MDTAAEVNTRAGALLIEELCRLGVRHFCLAPGSRSTPLAAAAMRHELAACTVLTDERSASFFALGVGRATRRPAVVITTSGTAVANCLPAVVEASQARVPLLILSADRPPELSDAGANQAIDQVKIFGGYPRWAAELPCPGGGLSARAALSTIDQAVARTISEAPGPVHLNARFREPLGAELPLPPRGPATWRDGTAPWTTHLPGRVAPSPEALHALRSAAERPRGLLVVGECTPAESEAARALALRLGWLVYADVTSGLRLGGDLPRRLSSLDLLLRSQVFAAAFRPDVVLHVGGPVVSKRYHAWIAGSGARHIRVHPGPLRLDPQHGVRLRIQASLEGLADLLGPASDGRGGGGPDLDWQARLLRASAGARLELPALTECSVAREVARHSEHGLFSASSMPVRDLDCFGDFAGPAIPFACNRGASGIDGTLATAAGWARGRGQRATLLIGDQALLHDLSSLALLRHSELTVVLVNNGGGGIFSMLPVAGAGDVFEQAFAGAHDLRFEGVARALGWESTRVHDLDELRTAIGKPGFVEVITERARSHADRQALIGRCLSGVEAALP